MLMEKGDKNCLSGDWGGGGVVGGWFYWVYK